MNVRVQEEDFDISHELEGLQGDAKTGAIVTFSGIVRDDAGTLDHMLIEHYPAMCEAAIAKMAENAMTRFALNDVRVIHRFGALKPGAQIMMVITSAPHRKDAFAAADFLMDYLKSRAPFWKKEVFTDGSFAWVDAKDDDEQALANWTD